MLLQVSVVPPELLDDVWPALQPKIERGLGFAQGDEHTPDTLKAAIARGEMQLWVGCDEGEIVAGMVVRVIEYPAGRKVFVEMVAGRDMDAWFDDKFHLLAEFRAINGAGSIEASCRPGMARYLEKHGWRRKAIVMETSQ